MNDDSARVLLLSFIPRAGSSTSPVKALALAARPDVTGAAASAKACASQVIASRAMSPRVLNLSSADKLPTLLM